MGRSLSWQDGSVKDCGKLQRISEKASDNCEHKHISQTLNLTVYVGYTKFDT